MGFFKKWPEQKWTGKTIMPHEKKGAFSISYEFQFGNKEKQVHGYGMDRMEFDGDKIKLNHVYLNSDSWAKWIRSL